MRSIYIDESAGEVLGGHVIVVAGYVASDEAWLAFGNEWQKNVLEAFSLPYFHATDLRNPQKRLCRHLDLPSRRRLLATASEVIVSRVEAGFGVYLRPKDWEQLTTKAERARWGGAYEVCVQNLLPTFSAHLATTERVNVFFEDGHKNIKAALRSVGDYKQATEPIQWPEMVGEGTPYEGDDIEMRMRTSCMRIADFASVKKQECAAVQAADLWAYLITTIMRNDTGVFSGVFDSLVQRNPHGVRGFGPAKLAELVEGLREYEVVRKGHREALYAIRGGLHKRQVKTHLLPWGIVIDKGDPDDDEGRKLQSDVEALRSGFNAIKNL